MTSTWVKADDPGECHTWRVWGSRIRKKQTDCTMEPRDLQSTTWYLNRTSLGTWDNFPVVSKIDGRELRVKKAMNSWARMRNISSEKQLLLCPTWSREWVGDAWRLRRRGWKRRWRRSRQLRRHTDTKNTFKIPDEDQDDGDGMQVLGS